MVTDLMLGKTDTNHIKSTMYKLNLIDVHCQFDVYAPDVIWTSSSIQALGAQFEIILKCIH